jgi:CheY-like chemotaxis protein/predicted transcriptional regulator
MPANIGSFSFDVAERILNRLCEGEINRTNLATCTGLNYNNLVRYLGMLSAVGWIGVLDKGTVTITPLGREIRKRFGHQQIGNGEKTTEAHSRPHKLVNEHEMISSSLRTSQVVLPFEARRKGELGQESKSSARQMQNILLVDDESDVAQTYDTFLKSTGRYNVNVFTKPPLAMKDFVSRVNYYDLIILDIRMPDINGLQMYCSMAAINRECKFLFVTSLDAVDELESVLPRTNVRAIIHKPIRKHDFVRIVDRLLVQD